MVWPFYLFNSAVTGIVDNYIRFIHFGSSANGISLFECDLGYLDAVSYRDPLQLLAASRVRSENVRPYRLAMLSSVNFDYVSVTLYQVFIIFGSI